MSIAVMDILPDILGRSEYQDKSKPWRWVLLAPVEVILSNGDLIAIPAGYRTDFASVPRLLRGIVATAGNHNLAVLIHDWLYDNRYTVTNGKDWKEDRLFADREMLHWLRRCGVSNIKAYTMYYAVRIGARSWWIN